MRLTFELDITAKQADDLAAELIADLISHGYEIKGYEVNDD